MGKHSPIQFEKYFEIHTKCLEELKADGVICDENLEIEQLEARTLWMRGLIKCRGGLELKVTKALKVSSDKKLIQATKYSYNLRLSTNKANVLRYDNAHVHSYKGHKSAFHVHYFDPLGFELPDSPIEIPNEDDWPTLTEVLYEADEYYWSNLYSPSLEL